PRQPALMNANPGFAPAIDEFSHEWMARASERGFHWGEPNGGGALDTHYLGDGVHFTEQGHAVVAAALLEATVAALLSVLPGLQQRTTRST
ncbi:MAG TPA: hypothetical protein VFK32_09115, partial [Tepidiformaceae bacterium]|nr:hypothetical protein [Tepidiformaceae bacterium]